MNLFRFCSFTGKSGWAAPRLKDADLSLDKLREGYFEVGLCHRCRSIFPFYFWVCSYHGWCWLARGLKHIFWISFCPFLWRIFNLLPLGSLKLVFHQMIMAMRTLYQKCKLVHGDLSEYNILYFEVSFHFLTVMVSLTKFHIWRMVIFALLLFNFLNFFSWAGSPLYNWCLTSCRSWSSPCSGLPAWRLSSCFSTSFKRWK